MAAFGSNTVFHALLDAKKKYEWAAPLLSFVGRSRRLDACTQK
jgi:hypothetical protein